MKKLNKFVAILVALAMMAALCITSAFAVGEITDEDTQAPAAADANLVKYLEIAESVTNPNAPFKFIFTPAGNTAGTGVTNPNIGPVTITPTTTTAASENDADSVYGFKTFAQTGEGILAGVTFPKAGVYTYTVAEQQSFDAPYELPEDMSVAFDTQSYTIRFYVDASGTVQHVTAQNSAGDKVDLTTEDPTTDTQDGGISLAGLTFDNKLTETEEVETPDPTNDLYGVLNIAKHVDTTSGEDIAAARANDEFKFTLELTKAYGQTATTVNATKRAANGTETTVPVSYGTQDISLKAGEVLYFAELPAGTTWKVTEDLPNSNNSKKDQYQAAYVVTSSDLAEDATASEAAGNALATGSYLLKEDTAGEKAVYTNTYDDLLDTPTGILINNLPYIVLALVAIGGLCAYVIVRRKADDEA